MREVLEAIWNSVPLRKPLHVARWVDAATAEAVGGYNPSQETLGLVPLKGARRACKPVPKVEWPDPPLQPARSSRPRKRKG